MKWVKYIWEIICSNSSITLFLKGTVFRFTTLVTIQQKIIDQLNSIELCREKFVYSVNWNSEDHYKFKKAINQNVLQKSFTANSLITSLKNKPLLPETSYNGIMPARVDFFEISSHEKLDLLFIHILSHREKPSLSALCWVEQPCIYTKSAYLSVLKRSR